ncbi:MAG: hypothetical protein M3Y82_10705 [Verrucomicrobiota bacterium]|nr:hypothetical protein [Verrucomicrobiota bacterium]
MTPALNWLTGSGLAKVEKKDYSWFFNFEQGGHIVTESFWRLVTPERIAVTSEDHEQLFGLKEPVNAAERVMTTIKNRTIGHYLFSNICSDLILYFEDKIELHFLNTSGGYESWRARKNDVLVVSGGGGRLLKYNLMSNKWVSSET